MSIAGIVLAGGRSSRFGSPKLDAQLDGRSLLDRAIEAAGAVAEDVIVVLGPAQPSPPLPIEVLVVRDPEAFCGPLVALATGLGSTSAQLAIVVGGDMPRLRPEVLRSMLAALDQPAGTPVAVVLADADGARPLPLAIRVEPARHAIAATLASGQRSLRALLDQLEVRVIPAEDWSRLDPRRETLIDVDRPEDLERVRASDPGERGLP